MHFILEMHSNCCVRAGAAEGSARPTKEVPLSKKCKTLSEYTHTSFSQSTLKCREVFACSVKNEVNQLKINALHRLLLLFLLVFL